MGSNFVVNDIQVVPHLINNRPKAEHFSHSVKMEGENIYASDVQVIGGSSPLFDAISYAFNNHCPLIIRPDDVWLTVLVGLSHHIDTDSEGLRHNFVEHSSKVQLEVEVDQDDWNTPNALKRTIEQFSDKIGEFIGKKKNLIVCNFSTTSQLDMISSQISLMGALKHYFEYKMYYLCGISSVSVEGTPEDWDDIYNRIEVFSEFGLSWWTDHLKPIIKELKRSCEGNPDLDFWNRIYLAHRYGSGSQYKVSGWINTFYPYIAGSKKGNMSRNRYVDWQNSDGDGLDNSDFPSGLVSVPVVFDANGLVYNFKFYGGLVGISLDDDFTVQTRSGFAIQNLGLKNH